MEANDEREIKTLVINGYIFTIVKAGIERKNNYQPCYMGLPGWVLQSISAPNNKKKQKYKILK